MKKKNEIDSIREKIVPVLQEHRISRASIFGSYARGEQKKKSDVDILVEIPDNRGLIAFIQLKIELEKNLKKKVDLVEYECIRKEFKKNILVDEVLIYNEKKL